MRPASQRRLLQVHRDKILCVELRGELFFGSSQQVLHQAREEEIGEGGGVLDLMHSRSRLTIDPRIPTMPGRVEMGGGERVSFVWFSWEGKACLDVPIHPQAPYERLRTAFSKYRSEPIQEGYSSPHFNTPP